METKSHGQIAYEQDCAIEPTYGNGQPRRTWSQLDTVSRWSWERNPTVRATRPQENGDRDDRAQGKTLSQDPGWMGDRTRGAGMGRENKTAAVPECVQWSLQRVRLNAGGYDSGGAYWGVGQPLYWASAGEADMFFRAATRQDAKAYVRETYPAARFYR